MVAPIVELKTVDSDSEPDYTPTSPPASVRGVLSDDVTRHLRDLYIEHQYTVPPLKKRRELLEKFGVTVKQVSAWYQHHAKEVGKFLGIFHRIFLKFLYNVVLI